MKQFISKYGGVLIGSLYGLAMRILFGDLLDYGWIQPVYNNLCLDTSCYHWDYPFTLCNTRTTCIGILPRADTLS